MKIGVIGGGSIGLLLSSYLCNQHEVTIYVRRDEQKRILNNRGLILSDTLVPFPIHTLLMNEMKEADCLIVCVKQHHVPTVLPFIKRLNRDIPLLFLQNGMGHIEYFQQMNNPIYVGVVEHGALRENDNHVNHTGQGVIRLATYVGDHQSLINLVAQLSEPNFPFEVALDWQQLLAEKLIVNAVINPLTALFGVQNKEVIHNPAIFHLAERLCREAATVLQLDYPSQWDKIESIADQTGENMSSMLIDLNNGRQTENDAISGYLMKNSKKEIPYTSFIYKSIKAIEFKNNIGKING